MCLTSLNAEAHMMVSLADRDGDGVLEYDEIIAMVQEQSSKLDEALLDRN